MLALTLNVRPGPGMKKNERKRGGRDRAPFLFSLFRGYQPRVRAVEQNSEIRRHGRRPAFIVATPRVHLYS